MRFERGWDTVILALMDERFELQAMYEANRQSIEAALLKPDRSNDE